RVGPAPDAPAQEDLPPQGRQRFQPSRDRQGLAAPPPHPSQVRLRSRSRPLGTPPSQSRPPLSRAAPPFPQPAQGLGLRLLRPLSLFRCPAADRRSLERARPAARFDRSHGASPSENATADSRGGERHASRAARSVPAGRRVRGGTVESGFKPFRRRAPRPLNDCPQLLRDQLGHKSASDQTNE